VPGLSNTSIFLIVCPISLRGAAGVKLALQFNEGLIGTIEPPRQDRFVGLVRSRRDYL
jgi:hypothetical protein